LDRLVDDREALLHLLYEYGEELKSLKKSDMDKGSRVSGSDEAESLFSEAVSVLSLVLDREVVIPRLVFYPVLKKMDRKFRRLSLGLALSVGFIALLVLYLVWMGRLTSIQGYYCSIPLLMVVPFPWSLYRRTREYIEYGSYYVAGENEGVVVIYDLPVGRFLSYSSHELASHVMAVDGPSWPFYPWGWSRGIQLLCSRELDASKDVDVLSPVLELVVGELRVALEWLFRMDGSKLPSWVKRIPSPYHDAGWRRWLGIGRSLSHETVARALSTAYFQLMGREHGEKVYRDYLSRKVDERWPFVSPELEDWILPGKESLAGL